jgi:predicted CopG family antitoxin
MPQKSIYLDDKAIEIVEKEMKKKDRSFSYVVNEMINRREVKGE